MGNTYSGPEKRKHERVNSSFVVVCQADQPLEKGAMFIAGKQFDAIMLDLSETGMAISLNHNIPASSRVYLDFTLVNIKADQNNQVKPMRLTGEVRYCTPVGKGEYRVGILFKHISPKNRAVIAGFVGAKKESK